MCVNTPLGVLASVIMGRAITGALLLACQAKSGHRVCLHFKCDGPLGNVFAEADFEGGCRGYVEHPQAVFSNLDARPHIGDAVGKGSLIVTSLAEGQQNPQVGVVEIQTGEVGDDIAYYLQQSEQTQSIVNLGTRLNEVGRIEASGGLIIEVMQDVPEFFLTDLETRALSAPPITGQILAGLSAEEILKYYFGEHEFMQLDHESRLHISCSCSLGRIENTLKMLAEKDAKDMLISDEDLSIRCQFCGKSYKVSQQHLRNLRNS